jgi:hypothetical protein
MSGNITPPPGFTLDRAPPPPPGFTLDARTKPAPDGLPWDVPYTGAQMRQAREQIRKGEEEIRALEPEPGLAHLLTGPIRVAQRGGQQALGERPLPTGVEALEEASLGVRPSKFTSAERPSAAAAPRVEPAVPGAPAPPTGFTLDAAPAPAAPKTAPETTGTVNLGGVTMGEAPRPGAPPAEPVPAPAVETETVAVPQADGTVRQVQVKTGEPPPPSEPPAPTTAEAPPTGPVNPADLRAGFPDLSDEQFEALFQQANREVPRPTTNDPADQQGWMKSVMGVMARLAVPAAAEEQKPTRITSSQVQARDGVGAVEAGKRAAAENAAQEQQKPADPWAPVAVAPLGEPDQETPIAQAQTETRPETQPEAGNRPETELPASTPAPSPEAPSPDRTPAQPPRTSAEVTQNEPVVAQNVAPIEAHGGPWTPTGKQNHLGEDVFENPNGVRAIMDNGVPWTEATKETDKGLVPKNPGNRKRQHLTTDEPWAEPAAKPKPAPKAAKNIPENIPKAPETAEKPKADWSLLGKNADGQDVYANPQGVHSTLVDGIRTVEAVRLKPTPQGMAMSVPPPGEKDPQFQVVAPATETGPEVDQKGTESVPIPAEAHPDSTPPSSDSSTTDEAAKPDTEAEPVILPPSERPPTPKSFWSYQAPTPPGPPLHMTQDQWEQLSPGMRREIWRSQPELWGPASAEAPKAEEPAEAEPTKPIPSSLDVAEQQAKKNRTALPGYDPDSGELVNPDAAFADILANSLDDPNHVIGAKGLMQAAEGIFGGTLANGILKRDRLYDAIELGVNTFIARHPERFAPTGDLEAAKAVAAELATLKDRIPTQTVRAGDKEKLQQFSTPPDYAFAVAWVANLKPGEVVIEPSAGTGGIAVHAMNAGAKVIGNEISPMRRTMMETLPFSQITKENAEQLHNILPRDIKPTAVVMNPPFSSAGDRMGGKMVIETGAVHIEQALKRLEPGGRLVAIVGDGMKPEGAETAGKKGRNNATGATFRDWWKKIGAEYDVRANIGVGGEIYRKYGTTFPTRLLVIDKVPPSDQPPVVTTAITSAELLDALQGVRDARPGSADQPVADQPGGAPVAPEGQGDTAPGQAVRSPTGDVGPGGKQDRPAAANRPKPANTGGGKAGGVRPGGRVGQGPVLSGDAPTVQQPKPLPQGGNGQPEQQPIASDVSGGSGTGGDTSHLRPDGSDLAVTPPAPELLETSIVVPEDQTGGELTESVYEAYKPQRVTIEGAQPHPSPLVQSAAMASVLPPLVTYRPNIPKSLIESGALSSAQLETITYAGNAHTQMLEKDQDGVAKRRGFFIGDGTGVGKGATVAGIILDNKWRGRKKALWVSEKMALSNDAKRDWAWVGQDKNEILPHNKIKAGDEIKHDGILFTTYDTVKSGEKFGGGGEGLTPGAQVVVKDKNRTVKATLKSLNSDGKTWLVSVEAADDKYGKTMEYYIPVKDIALAGAEPKTRVQQIVDWLGKDFDGVIAFDEAHNMANVTGGTGTRGKKEAAAKALAGLELQNALPNARVVYVSATGATEVSNLAYADRLGLWGPGTAFANRSDFLSRVSSGGVAAMELVARDMKALGYYTARSLSYDGVEYDRVQHDLTPPQRIMYDKIADAWQLVLRNMMQALEDTGADGKGGPKSAILSAFWGGHQRFFNQLITSLQMPSVIQGIDKDIAEGRQAVLQLVNTNEAGQERALDKSKARGDEDLEELDMSPRDQLLQLVEKAYPTRQYESYVDDEGNERVRPVSDSEGNPVHNPDGIAARDKLMLDLGSLRVPDGPLEILVNHYGPEAVAEVTGRKQRVVNKADETGRMKKTLEKRGADVNVAEANSFQSGKKKILIFSQAGGTGRSYHDDKTADRVDDTGRLGIGGNGARRSHYLVQAGWRADTAVQGFGRTHRTNQWTAPIFHLVTTDLEGQKRFISSIARRLGQLGALTKGERRTGDQGMFGLQDNLESDEAKAGLVQLFRDIHGGRVEGFTQDDLAEQMGLFIANADGSLKDELPPMTQFLNRVLSLKVDDQNRVFNEFATRFRDIVDRAAAAGTLDAGTETYKADKIVKVSDQVVYTDPNSGAETRHVHLMTHNRNYPSSFEEVMSGQSARSGWSAPQYFIQNKRSGMISAVVPTTYAKVEANGQVTEHYRIVTPIDWRYIPEEELSAALGDTLTTVKDNAEAKKLWDERVAKTPEFREADLHIITGAILPIWDRLAGQPKIFRLQTDGGERLLGRVVDNKVINQTLERLGAEGVKLNIKPADVVARIMDGGVANMANGWTIKRRRVAQEWRLELTGTDLYSHTAELEAAGVFRERIPGTYDTRYFIPTGTSGAGTIEAITKRRPIISLEGD